MNRAYKYRVYPTAEQEQLLTDTFGSCRFVYNHYLALQSENCQQGKAYRNKTACNNDCNRILKQEQPWLKQVDKFALTNAIYAWIRRTGDFSGDRAVIPDSRAGITAVCPTLRTIRMEILPYWLVRSSCQSLGRWGQLCTEGHRKTGV